MIKVTLDTGCVIDAAQGTGYVDEVNRLTELAKEGKAVISLTTGFEADQVRASEANRRANLEWLRNQPILHVGAAFRLDLSTLGGGDVLAGEDVVAIDERIKEILRPSYKRGHPYPERKVNDVHHLTAHYMSKNDVSVRRDADDMVRRCDVLKGDVGIEILTPPEAVAYVESRS